jgi:hypothetical protein
MPLRSPNLDDRDFDQLLDQAMRIIVQKCPAWTDHSAGDPGMVLLEVFAHLTETMIYRLNRVPEKVYIEFLRLIGVSLQPPAAARVTLTFTTTRPGNEPVEIPRGTRVAVTRAPSSGEPVVFTTARNAVIPPDRNEVEVLAHHCELVQGELAGRSKGLPGFSVTAAKPPIVAHTGEELDLVVGVQALPGELDPRAPAIEYAGNTYRIWREVENFTELGPDRFVYVADRMMGQIIFAPAAQMKGDREVLDETPQALAAIPPAGREIRLWYRHGGGAKGNVAANTLKTLKDPIPGVQVTNAEPATGGRAAETIENALVRGPQELHSLRRAVTASDFETLALRSSGAVTRAKAFTRSKMWVHAAAGTVDVVLVPSIPDAEKPGAVGIQQLQERQTEEARAQIQQALDERRPLGTACAVSWARYKILRVQARVVAGNEEDTAMVRKKVLERLYALLNPLPTPLRPSGWKFGQTLMVSDVFKAVLSQPGVRYMDQVRLVVDKVPEANVHAIQSDAYQPGTWHAASGEQVFRSMDNGAGWEVAAHFENEQVHTVTVHPGRPGLLAASTQFPVGGSSVYISYDCGETWEPRATTAFSIEGTAWLLRDGVPVLLMATSAGLYELVLQRDATPAQVFVHTGDHEHGFYAVAVSTDVRGGAVSVVVAAQANGGVYLSSDAGKANTFRRIGLQGTDVRVLAVQADGLNTYLWAGLAAESAGHVGNGCYSWQLLGANDPPEGWVTSYRSWDGGSCKSIAFLGSAVIAGSYDKGTLLLRTRKNDAEWEKPDLGCGLPLREAERLFYPIETVATNPQGTLILAGGSKGIYRSAAPDGPKQKLRFENCSNKVFLDKVTLPETWLFCPGEPEISVVTEDEARRD